MRIAPHTVLVAEDSGAFREFVCDQLRERSDVDVVSVEDGLAAVRAAAKLHPAMAVLDIGLPTLNGIEVARQIRAQSPASKVVFLTQEAAPEFVEAAIELGADGYVLKNRAFDYLAPVMEMMLAGHPGLDGRPRAAREGRCRHQAYFVEDDSALLASAERFVLATLSARNAAIVALSTPHLEALGQRLRRTTIGRAVEQGRLVMMDATDNARTLTAAGVDWDRVLADWRADVSAAGQATGQSQPRVAIFGEIAALLIAAGHVEAAMRLESLAEELVAAPDLPPLDITCVYPMMAPNHHSPFARVCAAHSFNAIR